MPGETPSKRIHAETYTQASALTSTLTTHKLVSTILKTDNKLRLGADEDSSAKRKAGHVYGFIKRKCFDIRPKGVQRRLQKLFQILQQLVPTLQSLVRVQRPEQKACKSRF